MHPAISAGPPTSTLDTPPSSNFARSERLPEAPNGLSDWRKRPATAWLSTTTRLCSSRTSREPDAAPGGGQLAARLGVATCQVPPKALIPSPLASLLVLSLTNRYSGCPL